MAFSGYLRIGWAVAAIVGTICTTSPTFASSPDRGFTSVSSGYVVIALVYDYADIMPVGLFKEQRAHVSSDVAPAFKPFSVKERASLAAVRPTSIAGWRSGRTRHLASVS